MIESKCGLKCSECSYREPCNCNGCAGNENPFWGECRLKKCCVNNDLDHCGNCKSFPCSVMNEFSYDDEHGDDGARIEQCKNWAKSTAEK